MGRKKSLQVHQIADDFHPIYRPPLFCCVLFSRAVREPRQDSDFKGKQDAGYSSWNQCCSRGANLVFILFFALLAGICSAVPEAVSIRVISNTKL